MKKGPSTRHAPFCAYNHRKSNLYKNNLCKNNLCNFNPPEPPSQQRGVGWLKIKALEA